MPPRIRGRRVRATLLLRPAAIGGALVLAATASLSASADAPPGRRTGDPMVEPRTLTEAEAAATRQRVAAVAQRLAIEGEVAAPQRAYQVFDLSIVDETELLDADGRVRAVIRTDGGSGDVRSVVRLDPVPVSEPTVVDRISAERRARRHASDGGLRPPTAFGDVRWDEAMDAWRVDWPRWIDGHRVIGDGLTVWVHRSGQLSALRRSESPAAAAPRSIVDAIVAETAARAWADRVGIDVRRLEVATSEDLFWIRPNDFALRGGADDTEAMLRLTYRVDLRFPLSGGGTQRTTLFVDAGSGRIIAGVETA